MTYAEISARRLRRQRVSSNRATRPEEVVRSLVAMQAQDYAQALWAVGVRMDDATESQIEQAIVERKIARTWPMRGTLHFVAASDVRWLLRLLTPRIIAARRRLVDDAVLARSRRIIEAALSGGRELTRSEVYELLDSNGISPAGQRGYHVLAMLALESVICFGPRRGKQHTFVLLDEWIPDDRRLTNHEALTELAVRYFSSRGPATVYDFATWSGLTIGDSRLGIELAGAELDRITVDGATYFDSRSPEAADPDPTIHLLPAFDETICGYRDRSMFLAPDRTQKAILKNGIIGSTVVHQSGVRGLWRRSYEKTRLVIECTIFDTNPIPQDALHEAAGRYRRFVGAENADVRTTSSSDAASGEG